MAYVRTGLPTKHGRKVLAVTRTSIGKERKGVVVIIIIVILGRRTFDANGTCSWLLCVLDIASSGILTPIAIHPWLYAGKQQVIDLLLQKVADVHAEPHVNFRK